MLAYFMVAGAGTEQEIRLTSQQPLGRLWKCWVADRDGSKCQVDCIRSAAGWGTKRTSYICSRNRFGLRTSYKLQSGNPPAPICMLCGEIAETKRSRFVHHETISLRSAAQSRRGIETWDLLRARAELSAYLGKGIERYPKQESERRVSEVVRGGAICQADRIRQLEMAVICPTHDHERGIVRHDGRAGA